MKKKVNNFWDSTKPGGEGQSLPSQRDGDGFRQKVDEEIKLHPKKERFFLPAAHASNLYVFYILRPSPSDIMNISFDKMKAFTMHSLRFYLLDWASSSVWDSYMWSGDSADSWQLCTSAHCSLLAEVKLKDRMIKRCRGLMSSGGAKAKSGCGCVWQVALSHCALHLPLGSPSLDQAETFHFSFF